MAAKTLLRTPEKHFAIMAVFAATALIAATGTAQAGSCAKNKSYSGPAQKLQLTVKNKTDAAFDVVMTRAKNTKDIKSESHSYKKLRSGAVEPGGAIDYTHGMGANANKVYSVSMFDTLSMFRINNYAGLTEGETTYKASGDNLEYTDYNQDPGSLYKISCSRTFSPTKDRWIVTFDVESKS
ncbi:MAG: hypothetical protein ABJH52_03315 [Henriciella sp.]